MIHVIAAIRVKPDSVKRFLEVFSSNVPAVRAEAGCIEYRPTVDVASGLAAQRLESDLVTIIEKWESLEALRAHLATPHMAAYREKAKDMVLNVSLKVLQDA